MWRGAVETAGVGMTDLADVLEIVCTLEMACLLASDVLAARRCVGRLEQVKHGDLVRAVVG